MQDTSSNNKRIAQNTMYMYIRTGISMIVSLYTSRIVLQNLGVDNYGIYNVVASFIVAFTFISEPLSSATQRFLNFELGRKGGDVSKVYNLSFYIYLVLAIILALIVEGVGCWYVSEKMIVPEGRLDATFFAFHFSVLCLVVSLLQMPFESLLIAYEKMSFYAYFSIVDVFMKLGNAYILVYVNFDSLKLYSINNFIISICIFSLVTVYCFKTIPDIRIHRFSSIWDKVLFRELFNFSGWSLFGSVSQMSANQGVNLLLNYFFGVAVNAAMGISNSVNAAVKKFIQNFQIAFRPQIVKYYASGEYEQLENLICNASRYSYILVFAFFCPIVFNIDFILKLWLGIVPEYTSLFCICMLVDTLISALSAPLWMAVHATGKIKKYQLVVSCLLFTNLFIALFFLVLGCSPVFAVSIKCVLDSICLIIRLLFAKDMVKFSIKDYCHRVINPLLCMSFVILVSMYICVCVFDLGWSRLFISCSLFIVIYGAILYIFILTINEKVLLNKYVIKLLNINKL